MKIPSGEGSLPTSMGGRQFMHVGAMMKCPQSPSRLMQSNDVEEYIRSGRLGISWMTEGTVRGHPDP